MAGTRIRWRSWRRFLARRAFLGRWRIQSQRCRRPCWYQRNRGGALFRWLSCFVKEAGGGWAARGARGKLRFVRRRANRTQTTAISQTEKFTLKNANRAKLKAV